MKGSGTSVWCTFSARFFHKNVPYLILYQWPKIDLSWIKLSSNGWQGEKEEEVEIQKIEYLKNEKSSLDEIKNIFHSFGRAII